MLSLPKCKVIRWQRSSASSTVTLRWKSSCFLSEEWRRILRRVLEIEFSSRLSFHLLSQNRSSQGSVKTRMKTQKVPKHNGSQNFEVWMITLLRYRKSRRKVDLALQLKSGPKCLDPNLKSEITRSILKINKRFIAHFNRWKEWILNFYEKLGKLHNIDLFWRKKNINFLHNCSKKLKLSQRKGSSLLITSIYLLVHAVSLFLCNILKYIKSKSTFSTKSRSTCNLTNRGKQRDTKLNVNRWHQIQSGSFAVHFFTYGHLKLPQDPFPRMHALLF